MLLSVLLLATTQAAAAGEHGITPHNSGVNTGIDGAQEMNDLITSSEETTHCGDDTDDCGTPRWGFGFVLGIVFKHLLGVFVVVAVVYSGFKFIQDIE